MGTRAPKFSCTGSHAALHRNEKPYFSRLAEPPMASETRMAARTLKTTSAKNQVRRSNSASFQRAGCRRLEAWSSCGIVANAGDMDCAATAAPGILKNNSQYTGLPVESLSCDFQFDWIRRTTPS